jgi:putative oxidoreductase
MPDMHKRIRDLIRAITRRLKWLPPLLVRIILGVVFIQSGWGKLHNISGTTENFAGWHIPFPHFNAVLASGTELFGGLLILLGLGTRLAAVPLIVVMTVAIITAKVPQLEDWTDFFGWDETAYAAMFLWLAIAGAGKASIDHFLGKKLDLTVEEAR